MKRLILLGAALLLPTFASAEMPSIHVGAMYEYLLPDQGALLRRVRNSGDATAFVRVQVTEVRYTCLLYTSPSPRDKRQYRMPSSA